MLRRALLVLCLSGVACSPLSPPVSDCGVADGGAGGGTAGGSGGGAGGGGGGTGGGGGGVGGGGGGAGGGAPSPLVFGNNTITTSLSRFGAITGIGGRTGEVFAINDYGRLYRSTGGPFTDIAPSPVSSAQHLLVLPDGAVFIVGGTRMTSCLSGCELAANYTSAQAASNESMYGLCGRASNDVYAVGEQGSSYTGVLYHFNGTSWTLLSSNLNVDYAKRCYVADDGTLYIAAQRNLVRYVPVGGSSFVESPDYTGITANDADFQQWYDVAGAGTTVFASGLKQRIMRRTGPGTWTWSFQPTGTTTLPTFRALAAVSPTEAYAFSSAASPTDRAYRWNGADWAKSPLSIPVQTPRVVWAESADSIWVGGTDGNSDIALAHGTR